MYVLPATCFISESATQDRQVCTYNTILWRVRVMFTPHRNLSNSILLLVFHWKGVFMLI
jgi:hypothetical protein